MPLILFVCWNGSLLWLLHRNICSGESTEPLKILHHCNILGILFNWQIFGNLCSCQFASNSHNASQFCFLPCWSISTYNLGRQVGNGCQGIIVYFISYQFVLFYMAFSVSFLSSLHKLIIYYHSK